MHHFSRRNIESTHRAGLKTGPQTIPAGPLKFIDLRTSIPSRSDPAPRQTSKPNKEHFLRIKRYLWGSATPDWMRANRSLRLIVGSSDALEAVDRFRWAHLDHDATDHQFTTAKNAVERELYRLIRRYEFDTREAVELSEAHK